MKMHGRHMMPSMPSCDDGQHRASPGSGAPGQERGQRGVLDRGVFVGQESGGECNMDVPSVHNSVLTNTEKKY